MKQELIINRLYSVICPLSSVFCLLFFYICREPSTNHLLFMQNKPNFRKAQMNVNSLITMNYENISDWTIGQSKPNSNPIKPNCKKAKMNVNLTLTKDYRKNDDFAVQQNKSNSNPLKANFRSNVCKLLCCSVL